MEQATVEREIAGDGPIGFAPVAEESRIASMDVLRGVALLGIFIANIPGFALPSPVFSEWIYMHQAPAPDLAAFVFIRVFVDYKFVTLFSLLFGAGLALQVNRARARGKGYGWFTVRRLTLLMVIGLAHGILVWYGDILFLYAVAGFALLALIRLRWQWLMGLSATAFVLGLVLFNQYFSYVLLFAEPEGMFDWHDDVVAELAAATPSGVDDRLERFRRELAKLHTKEYNSAMYRAEMIAYGEGPASAAIAIRSISFLDMLIIAGVFAGYNARTVSMFLLGAALIKIGFFKPSRRRWHRRAALVGLGVGLPLELLAALIYVREDFNIYTVAIMRAELLHDCSSLLVCMGYAGALCLVVRSGAWRRLINGLGATGRMALTNYIAQSFIASWVFYWWGLGLFNRLSLFQMLVLAIAVMPLMVLFSSLWLRVFRFGPLEWLWRSASYLKLQPLSKKTEPVG